MVIDVSLNQFQSDVEKAYKFGKVLGTGNFAEVRLATHRETNKK